jgi:enamine deaminase RidA (YjgF/YER057c/UK114 family)
MERDYAEFNRARRTFFRRMGVTLLPASTGINGSPAIAEHNFVLGFNAIKGPQPIIMEAMTTPTLNEANTYTYGSDFSRGLRVVDSNKIALYVSGTASVDEYGATVHVEDFEAQVDRMMLNVEVLLKRQKASLQDLVSAVTYIKRASDAPAFRRILRERGIGGFPNVIVEAGVCRPDLLCEIEGLALLPRDQVGIGPVGLYS